MDHYIDCHVKPEDEMPEPVLMATVFNQLHIALVDSTSHCIGLSFPAVKQTLGGTLRIHGNHQDLSDLDVPGRLARLHDHTSLTPIQPVPAAHGWVQLRRVQPILSAAKLRRLVKRGSVTPEEAELRLTNPVHLKLPYLQLTSSSTKQRFRLFVNTTAVEAPDITPTFNAYGFGSPVPAF